MNWHKNTRLKHSGMTRSILENL